MIEPWQVWLADLEPVEGHEQGGIRPVLVISSHVHIRLTAGRMVTVVPVSNTNRRLAFHVEIDNHHGDPTYVLTDQIRSISTVRFQRTEPWWTLKDDEIDRVAYSLRQMVDL